MIRSVVTILVLSLGLALPAAAATGEWTIDAPAGWRTDAAAEKMMRDQLTASKVAFDQLEVEVWRSSVPGAGLIVQNYVDQIDRAADLQHHIDSLDRGLVHGAFSSNPADASEQIVGSMVIRDVQVDKLGGRDVHARMVRRYQPAKDGLHVLMTMCTATGDLAPCSAALDSVRFTVADPIPLNGNRAYRTGYIAGKFATAIGGLLIVLLWLKRRLARARHGLSGESPTRPQG